ncbi:MAG: histidine--tRNA ligase [Deltaproteobacteria bacterium]|nr:histidine--tRNA ligase [Deltaproteobacteria bacterium]
MKIAAVRGFRDILPEESALWQALTTQARTSFAAYGFSEIIIPVIEKTELFARAIGETTDIVEKEMYTFTDHDDASLTLRPEGTASVIRAYIEHSLSHQEPVSKLFYIGPMFRRERPQKGRYRQFHQIGAEILGRDDSLIDAELLLMLNDFFTTLRLDVGVDINSLGCPVCRPRYRENLRAFGESKWAELCENCHSRLHRNPLRLLDCKEAGCRQATADAPVLTDFLCAPCRNHFTQVQAYLRQENVAVTLNPRLVRGLDYYCRTSFEVIALGLGSQNAVCGGGRYDGLVEQLGGPAVPGIGFAIGLERLAMLVQAQKRRFSATPDLFIAPLGTAAESQAFSVARRLRQAGYRVELESGSRGLKAQMRRADKLGARYVFILGENELAVGKGTIRDMQTKTDRPTAVDLTLPAQAMFEVIRNVSSQPSAISYQPEGKV